MSRLSFARPDDARGRPSVDLAVSHLRISPHRAFRNWRIVAAYCLAIFAAELVGTTPAVAADVEERALTEAALHTDATLRRVIEVRFDDPAHEVLPKLLTRVDLYDPAIIEVRFDHSASETPGQMGVGSHRICVFDDGRLLVEPLAVYDPPHAYGYTVDTAASTLSLPVSEIALLYDFRTTADSGTALTVRAFYDPRVPGTGPIIEPVLTGTLRRTFTTAAELFGGAYLGDTKDSSVDQP